MHRLRSYSMKIIGLGKVLEAHVALSHFQTTNQLMHRLRSYSTKIIGLGKVLEAHVALGCVSCYMTFSNFPSPNNFRRILAPVH